MNLRLITLLTVLGLLNASIAFATLPFVGPLPTNLDDLSFSNPQDVLITHVDLSLKVNFTERSISGFASFNINILNPKSQELILDTEKLNIQEVRRINAEGEAENAEYYLDAVDPIKGSALHIAIDSDTKQVQIRYTTSPDASGIIWTPAAETFGGKKPFMFTMGAPHHSRSWFPMQDTPQVRITFSAHVEVPFGIKAVMSGLNPHSNKDTGSYNFTLSKPIPDYLIALAAGDLVYRSTGPRSGVFSEPDLIEIAARQFSDTEEMIQTAESIFGPYQWDDFNILVLPPSANAGGMENPSLIYFHSMYLDGTHANNYIVAHELAHFWTSNLVGNSTWEDFWLNEGLATYGQRRITEKLYGEEFALNDAYQRSARLHSFIDRQRGKSDDRTILSVDLYGKDPGRYLNILPYEKSYLFLLLIEKTVGRANFDAFLAGFFSRLAFTSISTKGFISELRAAALNGLFPKSKLDQLGISEWIYKPGLPANAPSIISTFAGSVQGAVARWLSGVSDLSELSTENWTGLEYGVLIATLPANLDPKRAREIDLRFQLSEISSAPVLMAWLQKLIVYDFDYAAPKMQNFLRTSLMGRSQPVQLAALLCVNPNGWAMANEVFQEMRFKYSPNVAAAFQQLLNDTNPLK